MFTEKQFEEVEHVVVEITSGCLGVSSSKLHSKFGFLGGDDLDFELVVDIDLFIDRIRRLLEIGLRFKFAHYRFVHEALKTFLLSSVHASVSLAVVLSHST